VRGLLLAVCCAACAPAIDTPADHARATDAADAARLAAQLADLPGVLRADISLHRPFADPLTRERTAPGAAIVLVVDDVADPAALAATVRQLARATAPEIPEPAIAIAVAGSRPELTQLGPFTVEARSKPRLVALLAAAFALLALVAGALAWRERHAVRGNSAQ
jgi:hypothetical protein